MRSRLRTLFARRRRPMLIAQARGQRHGPVRVSDAQAVALLDLPDERDGDARPGRGDPERVRRFTSFVNAPDTPDPSITFEVERGQPVPALGERRPVVLGLPTMGVRQ